MTPYRNTNQIFTVICSEDIRNTGISKASITQPRATKRLATALTNAVLVAALVTTLGACAITPPLSRVAPQGATAAAIAPTFLAPLPIVEIAQQAAFKDWWAQFNDATLSQLITQATTHNPSLAQARASIVAARSVVTQSQAGLFPSVSATAGAEANGQRQSGNTNGGSSNAFGNSNGFSSGNSINNNSRMVRAGLDALWELDLFGFNQSLTDAARARTTEAIAQLGNASVSISAEVANIYVGLRTSQMLEAVYAQDSAATAQTAALTNLKIAAGFEAQADAGLVEGDAAESANRTVAQREQTALFIKALVALTNQSEIALRAALQLDKTPTALPAPKLFAVATVPAQLLVQRADVAAAAANVVAASADWRATAADQYPRISLLGNLGLSRISAGGETSNTRNWSIGPAISLPILDAGKRRAATDGAKARADAAHASFEQTALRAVQEAEEGLVRLDSATARAKTAQDAVRGYARYLEGAQLRHKNGLASLLELAQAQRTTVAANAALLQVQRERVHAWVALYKALGGGWQSDQEINASAAK